MMREPPPILETLAALGFAGVCHGATPTNEAEYLARVHCDGNAQLPPWSAILAHREVTRVELLRFAVRVEARRRVAQAMDYATWDDAQGILAENTRRMLLIMQKGPAATREEATELAELGSLSVRIDRIWQAYMAIPDAPPPDDFAHERWWPI